MKRHTAASALALTAALAVGLAAPTQAAPSVVPAHGPYARYAGPVVALPVGQRAYDNVAIGSPSGSGVRDQDGVRMIEWKGKLYNQPVTQSGYALDNLDSYRRTGNSAYLDIATRNAQRLIDIHDESNAAWYFPYDFDYPPLGDTSESLIAPWYSGMAQGRALSVFTRMYQATGDEKWRQAADATFLSFGQAPNGKAPYAAYVDASHRLWLEEYPRYPASKGENVLNGHIFALYGLLDYWQLTRDALALELIRGAVATVQQTAMTAFRRPKAVSAYSLRHRTPAWTYHQIHVRQFLMLLRYTKNSGFAATANAYRDDYPLLSVSGTLQATPHTSTIYQVGTNGRILRSKRVAFARPTTAPFDRRWRLLNGPVALRVSAGPYKGWYFPESFGVTWALGATHPHGDAPAGRVYFERGSYTAYKLDATGRVPAHRTVRPARPSRAP
ncbi:MAG: D-glucuronyl C5-epimerase family protein, partial [Marmoricola sp.]